jgi:hypothetical protein|uniref:Bifunctional inhibitor/plant lipid transfer protein/seed storage helical domain-containing protein n=1 Tax=Fagus sylvatica TaxID=28930 RepID=A0A2N9ESB0_FAGSY
MAKFTALAAILVALLFIAHTTAYRTIVTTTDKQSRSCREQLQQQQYLNECERFLRQQCQSQSGRRDSTSEQQQLEQCCDQLRDMSRRCRCDGLSELVSEQLGHLQGEERREILQIARNLPNECNLRPGRCDSEIRSN